MTYPVRTHPKELYAPLGSPPELFRASLAYYKTTAVVNSVFALGVFGAAAGGSLAIARWFAQRSKLLALPTGAASTIVAAGFGCLAGYLGNAIHRMSLPPALDGELSKSVVLHVAMLLTIGAGAGFSMGALMVGCWKAAASGLLTGAAAGFLAGAAFPVVTALLLPSIVTDMVVPDDPARMIWIGLALVLFGWTIPAFVRGWRSVGTA